MSGKMKVKGLDQEFRLALWNLHEDDREVWAQNPVTQEEADAANLMNALNAQKLMRSDRAQDKELAERVLNAPPIKAKKGEAWTLRKAVLMALCSGEYPSAPTDKETGKPKKPTPEQTAKMGYLAIAFSRAPQKPGAYVSIDESDAKLIRELAHWLGRARMHAAVLALMEEALDAAEGADARARRAVEFGVDEEVEALLPEAVPA